MLTKTTITTTHDPSMTVSQKMELRFEWKIGRRINTVTEQFASEASPAMLVMFRDRDRKPHRNMVPWTGEFAGNYLTHAVQIRRLSGDGRLCRHLEQFVKELCSCQTTDDDLGCWLPGSHLNNHVPNCSFQWNQNNEKNWETWSYYYMIFGLLLWNEVSGDNAILSTAGRITDLGTIECHHFVRFPLKAGLNLIDFRITDGPSGWMLSITQGAFVPKGAYPENIVSIYRAPVLLTYDARFNNRNFLPEDMSHFNVRRSILPGRILAGVLPLAAWYKQTI